MRKSTITISRNILNWEITRSVLATREAWKNISRTRNHVDAITWNTQQIKLSRYVAPNEIEIKYSSRWIIHLTKWDLIGIIMWVLIPEE